MQMHFRCPWNIVIALFSLLMFKTQFLVFYLQKIYWQQTKKKKKICALRPFLDSVLFNIRDTQRVTHNSKLLPYFYVYVIKTKTKMWCLKMKNVVRRQKHRNWNYVYFTMYDGFFRKRKKKKGDPSKGNKILNYMLWFSSSRRSTEMR